ncbi:MAG: DUF368 domain-containing protein [Flavobacteriales bacterium]|nr:MAG: DUF368 domain-containing protein [Flavobacteriales bacterium]
MVLALKGVGMGAANVIPGVSGGTIALITGIFEKLINSLKSCNIGALKLLFSGKFKEFSNHINLDFLVAVFVGIGVSVISLAKILEYLFENYPVLLWAFFFGLILASVYFVGKTVTKWSAGSIFMLLLGTVIAIGISLLNPTTENSGTIYIFICGIVAISSMILPGLSGSFMLILMGNYMLVLGSITKLDFSILLPFCAGCVFGLLAFSHLLAWVFKKFRDLTISVLTGFILGSLMILWPWKNEIYLADDGGNLILKDGEKLIQSYEWLTPELTSYNGVSFGLMFVGVICIWGIEKFAEQQG